MMNLAILLAFPGLFLIAVVRWRIAGRRYAEFISERTAYGDPTIEDVAEHGLMATFRRETTTFDATKAQVVAGEFGPEAQALHAAERRAFYIVGASIPVGIGLAIAVPRLVSRIGDATGAPAAAGLFIVAFVAALCAVAYYMLRTLAWAIRADKPRTIVLAYGLGLVGLAIGSAIALSRLLAE